MDSRPLHPGPVLRALALFVLAVHAHGAPQREAFVEEATLRNLDYVTDTRGTWGVGLGFTDLDADGDPDVVLIGSSTLELGLFENDGTGRFTDVSVGSGLTTVPLPNGISAADYDANGFIDVYVTSEGGTNRLFRNEGGLTFTDQTVFAGVGDPGSGQGCSWGDYDSDGWIDLYLANRDDMDTLPNRLYRNLGDGTFSDVAGELGVRGLTDPLTFQSSFVDVDNDGLQDLYLCTDKGHGCFATQNRLFRNLGGTFQDITDIGNAEGCVDCMGTGIGDFDGNGYFDFYCTNIPLGNVLLLNDGDGTFTEMGLPAGLRAFRFAWANMMFDYNNDTRLDLYVCNTDSPNQLFEQPPAWPCIDVAGEVDLDVANLSYTMAIADVEGDGDLDLLVHSDGENVKLFINKEGERRNWFQLRLIGREPNTGALGAKARIEVDGVEYVGEVRSGVGFKSESSKVLHFGLDAATQIDRVTVEWPYGARTVLLNVTANQRLTIREDRPNTFVEVAR